MSLSIRHKGILLVAVPLLTELVLLVTLGFLLAEADRTAKRIDHYRGIIASSTSLQKQFLDAGNTLVFYSVTHKASLLARFDQLSAEIALGLFLLTDAADKDKRHGKSLMRVCAIGNETLELLDQTREGVGDASWLGAITKTRLPDRLLQITNDFYASSQELVDELQKTEQISPQVAERVSRLQYLCLGFGLLVCITFIFLSMLFYKQIASRLGILMDNTKRFAEGQSLSPVLKGDDEIASLDQVFHEMSSSIEEAAEFRRQIVATVSHELRTPLTSIKAFLTLLADGTYGEIPSDAELRSKLAKDQVDRLIRLLNDLLAAESIRAKGFTVVFQKVEISELVHKALDAVGYIAKQYKVALSSAVAELELEADGDRVLQVLVNLVSNAIKFSPAGEEVRVETELEQAHLLVKVLDRGRGVPAEMREEIFNRHSQVSEADKKKEGGMGLGLAICKAIVLQHGGKIGCDSNGEKGSIFWFRLPLQQNQGQN